MFFYFFYFYLYFFEGDDDELCTSKECVLAAANLLKDMDTSVDPCQNFYRYSCGGYIKKNPIPQESPSLSVIGSMQTATHFQLSQSLQYESGDGKAFTTVRNFYESEYSFCLLPPLQ